MRGNGKPFRIVERGRPGRRPDGRVPAHAGAVQILTINFQPNQPGPVQRTLTVKTDLDGGTVTIKVDAVVQ